MTVGGAEVRIKVEQEYYFKAAAKLRKYYEGLLKNSRQKWSEPYQCAKRWEELLKQSNISEAEKKSYLNELRVVNKDYGSAWTELLMIVSRWAKEK